MEAVLIPLFGFLGVLATALLGYLATRRRARGTIETSEASDIWAANKELRDMLLAEAATRTAENSTLRKELDERRREADQCHRDNAEMAKRIAVLEEENTEIKQELADMVAEIKGKRP